jgi:hypothetical protein
MKKQLLPVTILAVAQSFGNAKKAFSAHDITNTIRNLVNAGEVEIVGIQQTVVDGMTTQEIEHETVRDLVRGIYDAGIIDNLKREDAGAGFHVYHFENADLNSYERVELDDSAPLKPATPAVAAKAVAGGNKAITSFVNNAASSPTAGVVKDRSGKILTYLNNRRMEGVSPTLKQIQSRLKEYPGFTTSQIKDFVSLKGYRTEQKVGSPFSKTRVLV